jgi:hypothetical protein
VKKKIVFGFAALAGLFLIGSLMESRESRAKGAYSTPVSVVNTTANPGSVLDAEKATRIPYQSGVYVSTCINTMQCMFTFTQVPVGYRLVAENISASLQLASGTTVQPSVRLEDGSLNAVRGFQGTVGQGDPVSGLVFSGFNQNIRGYFDSSDGAIMAIVTARYPSVGVTQAVTLTGYLENCAVVGCPAIQR